MPLEGISRGFKDISFSFQTHPLTGDLITLSNETAIARSLQNLSILVFLKGFLIKISDVTSNNLCLKILI
jgi:hypothetical protein